MRRDVLEKTNTRSPSSLRMSSAAPDEMLRSFPDEKSVTVPGERFFRDQAIRDGPDARLG